MQDCASGRLVHRSWHQTMKTLQKEEVNTTTNATSLTGGVLPESLVQVVCEVVG